MTENQCHENIRYSNSWQGVAIATRKSKETNEGLIHPEWNVVHGALHASLLSTFAANFYDLYSARYYGVNCWHVGIPIDFLWIYTHRVKRIPIYL